MHTAAGQKLPLLNPVPLTAELAAAIQALIDAQNPDSRLSSALHALKHQYNALPIMANSIYIWAIRADGEVLCMDHEAFSRPCERETDARMMHVALASGARIHPVLQAARPRPPSWAVACGQCAGAGQGADASDARDACARCEGTGWHAPR